MANKLLCEYSIEGSHTMSSEEQLAAIWREFNLAMKEAYKEQEAIEREEATKKKDDDDGDDGGVWQWWKKCGCGLSI